MNLQNSCPSFRQVSPRWASFFLSPRQQACSCQQPARPGRIGQLEHLVQLCWLGMGSRKLRDAMRRPKRCWPPPAGPLPAGPPLRPRTHIRRWATDAAGAGPDMSRRQGTGAWRFVSRSKLGRQWTMLGGSMRSKCGPGGRTVQQQQPGDLEV